MLPALARCDDRRAHIDHLVATFDRIRALPPLDVAEWEGDDVIRVAGAHLSRWPEGTRAIARREEPHPGAQLTFTDVEGHRFQVLITDQIDPDIAEARTESSSA